MYLLFGVVGVLIFLYFMFLYIEKRDFNSGDCRKCGTKMYNFDTDSQGARGYTCPKCGYYTWVSHSSVERLIRK